MLRPKVNRVELVQPVGKRPGRGGRHQQNIYSKVRRPPGPVRKPSKLPRHHGAMGPAPTFAAGQCPCPLGVARYIQLLRAFPHRSYH